MVQWWFSGAGCGDHGAGCGVIEKTVKKTRVLVWFSRKWSKSAKTTVFIDFSKVVINGSINGSINGTFLNKNVSKPYPILGAFRKRDISDILAKTTVFSQFLSFSPKPLSNPRGF